MFEVPQLLLLQIKGHFQKQPFLHLKIPGPHVFPVAPAREPVDAFLQDGYEDTLLAWGKGTDACFGFTKCKWTVNFAITVTLIVQELSE